MLKKSFCTTLLGLLLLMSCSPQGNRLATPSVPPEITLFLQADKGLYTTGEAVRGTVGFTAVIHNTGSETVTLAHPTITFPASFQPGDRLELADKQG